MTKRQSNPERPSRNRATARAVALRPPEVERDMTLRGMIDLMRESEFEEADRQHMYFVIDRLVNGPPPGMTLVEDILARYGRMEAPAWLLKELAAKKPSKRRPR